MPHNKQQETVLLDYYGELLTDHQRNIMEEYFYEDLSMNEIADNLNISKSAVQDLIKRSVKQLNEYDSILKLIENDNKISDIIQEMYNENDKLLSKYADKLKKAQKKYPDNLEMQREYLAIKGGKNIVLTVILVVLSVFCTIIALSRV